MSIYLVIEKNRQGIIPKTDAIKLWSRQVSSVERLYPWLKDAKEWSLELERKFALKRYFQLAVDTALIEEIKKVSRSIYDRSAKNITKCCDKFMKPCSWVYILKKMKNVRCRFLKYQTKIEIIFCSENKIKWWKRLPEHEMNIWSELEIFPKN